MDTKDIAGEDGDLGESIFDVVKVMKTADCRLSDSDCLELLNAIYGSAPTLSEFRGNYEMWPEVLVVADALASANALIARMKKKLHHS